MNAPPQQRHPNSATPAAPVLVVGLGVTGLSCARYFARLGQTVRIVDSRATPPALAALGSLREQLDLRLGSFDPAALDGVAEVVVSPGVSLDEPLLVEARGRGLSIAGDIELFARVAPAPVACVTGSNGKSTVTSLLAELLAAGGLNVRAGGNLGTPALDLLEGEAPELYVLELSSFQLETTESLRPLVATVLNVSPDHIDRHGSLERYAAAKARIYRGAQVAVVNRDDPLSSTLAGGERRVSFGLDAPPGPADFGLLQVNGVEMLARGEQALIGSNRLALRGRHNLANALAALAMAEAAGVEPATAAPALAAFRGLAHRCEFVAEIGGVVWIDDSKGTNVGASVAAIAGMDRPVVLVAGGDGKGADFAPLAQAARGRVHAAVLIGRDAPLIERALAGICPVAHVGDMGEAVAAAARLARPGDTVLLSPACSSTDMFTDYRERGRQFAAAVRELAR